MKGQICVIFIILIILGASYDGVPYSMALPTIIPDIEFIGSPIFSTLDYNKDELIDVVFFDQQVNVTSPGTFLVEDIDVTFIGHKTTGEELSMKPLRGEKIIEFQNTGLTNLSIWVGSGQILSGLSEYNDSIDIKWKPSIQPLDENYALIGQKTYGIETIITFEDDYQLARKNFGLGLLSPTAKILLQSTAESRTIGEEYLWKSYLFSTEIYPSFQIGLGEAVDVNTTFIVKVIDVEKELIIQTKIGEEEWSFDTMTGYPYSTLFLPKNSDPQLIFKMMKDLTGSIRCFASKSNESSIWEHQILDNDYLGYNLTVYSPLNGIYWKFKMVLVYNLPLGILTTYTSERVINNNTIDITTLKLGSSILEEPEWVNVTIPEIQTTTTETSGINTTTSIVTISSDSTNSDTTTTTVSGFGISSIVICIFIAYTRRKRGKKNQIPSGN